MQQDIAITRPASSLVEKPMAIKPRIKPTRLEIIANTKATTARGDSRAGRLKPPMRKFLQGPQKV